jgi:hypothetical protein
MRTITSLGLGAGVAASLALGCGAIPVQMNTSTTIQHMDGPVEHKESRWEGTLDQQSSIEVISESGSLTGKMSGEISGFKG